MVSRGAEKTMSSRKKKVGTAEVTVSAGSGERVHSGRDCRSRALSGPLILGVLAVLGAGSSIAQEKRLPPMEHQQPIMEWLKACDLNKDLASVTCPEIEYCFDHLWESAELLERTPDENWVLVDRTVDSVVLVATYSFGKRWWK